MVGERRVLTFRGHVLELGRRTLVMGILNVTPDSFSDGGSYATMEAAVARARQMVADGADIVDVGGESTRPGAVPVPAEEEMRRVLPVVEAVAGAVDVPVSVDTYKAGVARAAIERGASMINDVGGLQEEAGMAEVAAEARVPVVAMHGLARHRRGLAEYPGGMMEEVKAFLRRSLAVAGEAGLPDGFLLVDPGFGFGKAVEHNLELTARLGELRELGCPVLLGPSRKSTIGRILRLPVHERLEGTAALVALAVAQGVDVVRVHDVKEMVRVVRMADAVIRRTWPELVYLGLGSNVGDRGANLAEAVRRLRRVPGLRVLRLSRVYETEPVGPVDQPWFLNQVAEAECWLDPGELLDAVLEVERAMGRERRERWGPRVIDVDILLYGERQVDRPGLRIPHPLLRERGFVLVPLAELAADLDLGGATAGELARAALAAGPAVRPWGSGPLPEPATPVP